MIIILGILIYFSASVASANEALAKNIVVQMREAQEKMNRLRKPDFASCKNLRNKSEKDCLEFYSELRAKSTIRIDFFLGYLNGDTLTYDKYRRRATELFLSEPCQEGAKRQTCGFQRNPEDADLFYKEVIWPDGTKKKFEIRLNNPSVTANDKRNRESPRQKAKSELIRKKFMEAAGKSDVLIYDGHSRYGGGPDFFPEVLNENGSIDPKHYRNKRTGIQDLMSGLGTRRDKGPTMLAMLSCSSEKHFHSALQRAPAKAKKAVLTNDAIGIDQAPLVFVQIMDTLLKGSCPSPDGMDKDTVIKNYR